jgi:AAA15 family ATPase/GTPase
MIQSLHIENYKSIHRLTLPCKKLNVFIGEPNSGKSNFIEALSLLSQDMVSEKNFKQVIRFKTIGDLFFDFNINQPIIIKTGVIDAELRYKVREDGITENRFSLTFKNVKDNLESSFTLSHDGTINQDKFTNILTEFRYYEYKRIQAFQSHFYTHLISPYGENLPGVLLSNSEHKRWVSDFFQSKGFKLTLKPAENDINMSKLVDEEIYSYPYYTISETMQRVVFYMLAMKTNKSNTFPFYTKFLAESIALDDTNQFFITTHNPYLLGSLIQKSKLKDINIVVVRMKDYKTEAFQIKSEKIKDMLSEGGDVFFDLSKFIEND